MLGLSGLNIYTEKEINMEKINDTKEIKKKNEEIKKKDELNANQYAKGKRSEYKKYANGGKIKTIERIEYPNGVVKEKLIHVDKGSIRIF